MMKLNNFVQATPVFAILSAVGQVPGAPDENRWAVLSVSK